MHPNWETIEDEERLEFETAEFYLKSVEEMRLLFQSIQKH